MTHFSAESRSLSPTASPYLRLPMTDEMMARRSARNSREDRHHLYHSTVDGGLLMMDDPCYEPGPGPSASLSLTQRSVQCSTNVMLWTQVEKDGINDG